jgi:hypothetical protein
MRASRAIDIWYRSIRHSIDSRVAFETTTATAPIRRRPRAAVAVAPHTLARGGRRARGVRNDGDGCILVVVVVVVVVVAGDSRVRGGGGERVVRGARGAGAATAPRTRRGGDGAGVGVGDGDGDGGDE